MKEELLNPHFLPLLTRHMSSTFPYAGKTQASTAFPKARKRIRGATFDSMLLPSSSLFFRLFFYGHLQSLNSPVRMLAMTPPSMSRSVPVMNLACSPSRKAAASAISSLVPVRRAAEASIMSDSSCLQSRLYGVGEPFRIPSSTHVIPIHGTSVG